MKVPWREVCLLLVLEHMLLVVLVLLSMVSMLVGLVVRRFGSVSSHISQPSLDQRLTRTDVRVKVNQCGRIPCRQSGNTIVTYNSMTIHVTLFADICAHA
jgi:hypothetical protein